MTRTPIVDLRRGPRLARHAGRPDRRRPAPGLPRPVGGGRGTLAHRDVSDEIAALSHTPGARLSNVESDAIHAAHRRRQPRPSRLPRTRRKRRSITSRTSSTSRNGSSSALPVFAPARCDRRDRGGLAGRVVASREPRGPRPGAIRQDHRVLAERSGRGCSSKDATCAIQLDHGRSRHLAHDRALDAGADELTRRLGHVSTSRSGSRSPPAGSRMAIVAVAIQRNGEPLVERANDDCKIQAAASSSASSQSAS